jgi:hypothetical protein
MANTAYLRRVYQKAHPVHWLVTEQSMIGFLLLVFFLLFVNYITGFGLIGLSILALAVAVLIAGARS